MTQLRRMVEYEKELAVSYCKLVAVSIDTPKENGALRVGLGANFPILSDAEHTVQKQLGLHDPTAPEREPLLPADFVLYPDLRIFKIYNGYWYVGRAMPEDLRVDFRELSRLIRKDWDPIGIEAQAERIPVA